MGRVSAPATLTDALNAHESASFIVSHQCPAARGPFRRQSALAFVRFRRSCYRASWSHKCGGICKRLDPAAKDFGLTANNARTESWAPSERHRRLSVGDTGIEPVTSSVSRKRATTAPIAPVLRGGDGIRTRVDGFAGRCLASRPLHQKPQCGLSSGRRDSNPRPSPWQGDALPAALRPRCVARIAPTRQSIPER